MRFGGALWRFWWLRGHVDEGQHWLDVMGRLAGDAPIALDARLWAQALHGAGWLSRPYSFGQATALLEHSLSVATQAGDAARQAAVLFDLGQVARLHGQ